MDFKDRQWEAMRPAARIESEAAEANSEAKSASGKEWEANSEAKSAGGKEWEPEFLFFYRCHTSLVSTHMIPTPVGQFSLSSTEFNDLLCLK